MPQPEVDIRRWLVEAEVPPYSFGKRKKLIKAIEAVAFLGSWKGFLFLFL